MALNCPFLTDLALNYMQLGDEAMTLISRGNWQFLRELDVSNNEVTWKGVRTLAQTGEYKYLEVF